MIRSPVPGKGDLEGLTSRPLPRVAGASKITRVFAKYSRGPFTDDRFGQLDRAAFPFSGSTLEVFTHVFTRSGSGPLAPIELTE